MSNVNTGEMNDPDSCQSGFSQLRRLARNVDIGLKEVKVRIEEIEEGVGSEIDYRLQYSAETAAMLFLQRSQKDIKSIRSDVKDIHADFKMRSAALNSINDLFGCALESFRNRLNNVEQFTEQYGYKRPVFSVVESLSPSATDGNVGTEGENEASSEGSDLVNQGEEIADQDQAELEHKKALSDPGTPKLDDNCLSQSTLFILNSGNADNGCTTPARTRRTVLENDHSSAKSSNGTNEGMSTPKLEAYGISEHTLKYLLSDDVQDDIPTKDPRKPDPASPGTPTLNGVSLDYNFESNFTTVVAQEKEKSNDTCFDLPPTPKLEGFLSENTLMFLNDVNTNTVDKENISSINLTPVADSLSSRYHQSPVFDPALCQSQDSPYVNMPATPKLDSLGLSQHTLRFLNSNEENLF